MTHTSCKKGISEINKSLTIMEKKLLSIIHWPCHCVYMFSCYSIIKKLTINATCSNAGTIWYWFYTRMTTSAKNTPQQFTINLYNLFSRSSLCIWYTIQVKRLGLYTYMTEVCSMFGVFKKKMVLWPIVYFTMLSLPFTIIYWFLCYL